MLHLSTEVGAVRAGATQPTIHFLKLIEILFDTDRLTGYQFFKPIETLFDTHRRTDRHMDHQFFFQ
jgi:hypothetical protein